MTPQTARGSDVLICDPPYLRPEEREKERDSQYFETPRERSLVGTSVLLQYIRTPFLPPPCPLRDRHARMQH